MAIVTVDIETTNLETRNKKGGGTYHLQQAFVHLSDRDGQPKRYPTEMFMFPPRDDSGNPIPYKTGTYQVCPSSFRVVNGFLELGFLNLVVSK